jgi:hypothetical protein
MNDSETTSPSVASLLPPGRTTRLPEPPGARVREHFDRAPRGRHPTLAGSGISRSRSSQRLPLRRFSRTAAGLAVAAVTLLARAGGAEVGRDVASVFLIAKSENRNEVHYGIRLDAGCAPVGPAPVFAYWRMLEHGPLATEPLLPREVDAYGFADQRVVERGAEGGRVAIRLHALPGRPIVVETRPHAGVCEATATTRIDGGPATLQRVFAQLKWPFGIDHLLLSGRSLADGRPVEERIAP